MNSKSERTLTAVLQGMIMERQRLLIREANNLCSIVGLSPVRVQDGMGGTTTLPPRDLAEPEPAPATVPTPLALNYNRRAILRAVAVALERGEEPTYSVIRAISGIPERSATRALKWALENGVLLNRGGAYVPGEGWTGRDAGGEQVIERGQAADARPRSVYGTTVTGGTK